MHLNRRALLAGLLGLAAAPAAAQGLGFGLGVQDVVVRAGGGASLPLDGFTTPSAAYSFRKLKSTYAGPAIRIRRASDSLELDINFLGYVPGIGAPWDEAAAAAHCAATNCFMRFWYDQSGLTNNLSATGGSQPQLIFNCKGTLPCAQSTDATIFMSSLSAVTPVSPVTLSTVGARMSGTTGCSWRQNGGNNRVIGGAGVANQLSLTGTGTIVATAADGVWHAATGVINGAASVFGVDGAELTGTVTAITTSVVTQIVGNTGATCRFGEYVVWNGYGLTTGERPVIQANQKSYWGTP